VDRSGEPVILVGVSGSGASLAALSWAAREAQRRDATLRVIQAWQSHPARAPYAMASCIEPEPGSPTTTAGQLAVQVKATLGGTTAPDLVIELIEGAAERILAQASATAELLVLGSATHSQFGPPVDQLLLDRPVGPVIRACLSHSRCPVVVIGPAMAADQRARAATLAGRTR